MPHFSTTLFGNLSVGVYLTEEGEIEDIEVQGKTETGPSLDLTGIKFPIYTSCTDGTVIHGTGDVDDFLRREIEDCMNDWHYEQKEFRKARGRDRLGE